MRNYALKAGLAATFISLSIAGAFANGAVTPLEQQALVNHDQASGDADLAAPAQRFVSGEHGITAKLFKSDGPAKGANDLLVQEAIANHQ